MKKSIVTVILAFGLVACSGDSTQDLKTKAVSALENKEFSTAEIHLKNLLLQDGRDAEARTMLAQIYLQRGNWSSAEKELRRALEFGIARDRIAVNLLAAMSVTSEPQPIIEQAKELASEDPKVQAGVLYHSATALWRLNQRDAAIEQLREAVSLDDSLLTAKIALYRFEAQQGEEQLQASITSLNAMLEQSPDNIEALVTHADLLTASGQPALAWDSLSRAQELSPNNVQTLMRLANHQLAAGKFAEAAPLVDKGLKLAPSSPLLLTQKAQIEQQAGRHGPALDAAAGALNSSPDYVPALSVAAAAAMDNGSLERAESYANRLVRMAPDSSRANQLLGAILIRKGQPDEALALLQPLISAGAKDPTLLAIAGEAAMQTNQPGEALRFFEGAVSTDASDPTKRLYLAMAKLSAGDSAGGIADLQTAAEMSPDASSADYTLISQFIKNKEFDKANAAIAELEKKQPGRATTPYLEGMVFLAQRNLLAARVKLNKAIEIDEQFFEATAKLAAIDLAEGKLTAAGERIEAFLAKEPEHQEALLSLAQLKLAEPGNEQSALELIERASKSNPSNVRPLLMKAALQIRTKSASDAVTSLEAGLARNTDHPKLLEMLANAHRANGSSEKALATVDKLSNLKPNDAGVQYRLANLRLQLADNRGALNGFRLAQTLQPQAIEPRIGLATTQARMGNFNDALTSARAMQSELPNIAAGWLLEGELHTAQKNWLKAAEAYDKGLEIEPKRGAVYVKLDGSLRRAGKTQEADARLATALIKLPDDPQLQRFAGDLAATRKDYAAAIQHYQKTVTLSPTDAIAWNNLAWAQHKRGDGQALESAEKSLALNPDSAPALDTLAEILADTGDTDRAVTILHRAVKLAPSTMDYRLRLALTLKKADKADEAKKVLTDLIDLSPPASVVAAAKKMLSNL